MQKHLISYHTRPIDVFISRCAHFLADDVHCGFSGQHLYLLSDRGWWRSQYEVLIDYQIR